EALHDLLLEPGVRLLDQHHPGVHAVELQVHERLVFLRDFPQQPLSAAPHHRLEKPHELEGRDVPQRALQQRPLGRLGHAGGVERHRDALLRLHRSRDGVYQAAVQLDRPCASRLGREQQRLGVVAGDGRAFHDAPPPASSCASSSLDAAAIESSTASRRSSTMAFSFSASISWRARSSSCSYSCRALASRVSRSLSASAFAFARISCASALAVAMVRLCSSSSRAASVRARSASSICCWIRRSRSSTVLRRAGQPNRQSSASRIPKTTMVQKISPVLMEKGVNSPSWTSSSASI